LVFAFGSFLFAGFVGTLASFFAAQRDAAVARRP
jgi:hypothetical protein